jgi:ferredoxin
VDAFLIGECDYCTTEYDTSSRSDHCADCGTCWDHCRDTALHVNPWAN